MAYEISKTLIDQIAAGVALAMFDDGWYVVPTDIRHLARIANGHGHVINLNAVRGTAGCFSISGEYADKDHAEGRLSVGHYLPRINVSWAKPPDKIAADIVRRFLPLYIPIADEAIAWKATQVAEKAEAGNTASQLAAIAPGATVEGKDQNQVIYMGDGEGPQFSVMCNDADRVQLDLRNVSPDKAKAIIALLLSGE